MVGNVRERRRGSVSLEEFEKVSTGHGGMGTSPAREEKISPERSRFLSISCEYVVKLEKRLAISVSSDEDEDLEDDDDEKEEEEEEKSESELDGDYVSSNEARELSENVEERERG